MDQPIGRKDVFYSTDDPVSPQKINIICTEYQVFIHSIVMMLCKSFLVNKTYYTIEGYVTIGRMKP
jgi:hypothetical protein